MIFRKAQNRPDLLLRADLEKRMSRPQRHRLLHGYPMAPLMTDIPDRPHPRRMLQHESVLDPTRPLIVGVLPHTFCNPAVRGCGFCTFPHETYSNPAARAVVERVVREVRSTPSAFPEACARPVHALYFGGGTANLTPPDCFAALTTALAQTFSLADAEVTLEGVPRYFLTRSSALLDVLDGMPVRHRRLSMGVQTFDEAWLARMGRSTFGTAEDILRIVEVAHARKMTTSCDLLYNLPGQTLEGCLADVRRACELGFDQVCVYNLVLDEGMDTEWAKERSLVTRVPDRETGCAHWLAVRRLLIDRGYVQTTLTNFERRDIFETERRFRYESYSFQPATYDALGFGPGAISTFTSVRDKTTPRATKWMNEVTADAFVQRIDGGGGGAARFFAYRPKDLELLHVTRRLAMLSIDRPAYRAFFGTDVLADFPGHFELLQDARLLRIRDASIEVTPQGMFFADTIAGLLASQRAAELVDENDATSHAMG